MKTRILTLWAIIAITILTTASCSKSNTEVENQTKSYQIVNNNSFSSDNIEHLDGSMYEVVVFQYKGEDVVKEDNLPNIASNGGKSAIIETHELCEKIQISFKVLPRESPYYDISSNNRKYVITKYYLTSGKTEIITLDGNTLLSGTRATKSGGIKMSEINFGE